MYKHIQYDYTGRDTGEQGGQPQARTVRSSDVESSSQFSHGSRTMSSSTDRYREGYMLGFQKLPEAPSLNAWRHPTASEGITRADKFVNDKAYDDNRKQFGRTTGFDLRDSSAAVGHGRSGSLGERASHGLRSSLMDSSYGLNQGRDYLNGRGNMETDRTRTSSARNETSGLGMKRESNNLSWMGTPGIDSGNSRFGFQSRPDSMPISGIKTHENLFDRTSRDFTSHSGKEADSSRRYGQDLSGFASTSELEINRSRIIDSRSKMYPMVDQSMALNKDGRGWINSGNQISPPNLMKEANRNRFGQEPRGFASTSELEIDRSRIIDSRSKMYPTEDQSMALNKDDRGWINSGNQISPTNLMKEPNRNRFGQEPRGFASTSELEIDRSRIVENRSNTLFPMGAESMVLNNDVRNLLNRVNQSYPRNLIRGPESDVLNVPGIRTSFQMEMEMEKARLSGSQSYSSNVRLENEGNRVSEGFRLSPRRSRSSERVEIESRQRERNTDISNRIATGRNIFSESTRYPKDDRRSENNNRGRSSGVPFSETRRNRFHENSTSNRKKQGYERESFREKSKPDHAITGSRYKQHRKQNNELGRGKSKSKMEINQNERSADTRNEGRKRGSSRHEETETSNSNKMRKLESRHTTSNTGSGRKTHTKPSEGAEDVKNLDLSAKLKKLINHLNNSRSRDDDPAVELNNAIGASVCHLHREYREESVEIPDGVPFCKGTFSLDGHLIATVTGKEADQVKSRTYAKAVDFLTKSPMSVVIDGPAEDKYDYFLSAYDVLTDRHIKMPTPDTQQNLEKLINLVKNIPEECDVVDELINAYRKANLLLTCIFRRSAILECDLYLNCIYICSAEGTSRDAAEVNAFREAYTVLSNCSADTIFSEFKRVTSEDVQGVIEVCEVFKGKRNKIFYNSNLTKVKGTRNGISFTPVPDYREFPRDWQNMIIIEQDKWSPNRLKRAYDILSESAIRNFTSLYRKVWSPSNICRCDLFLQGEKLAEASAKNSFLASAAAAAKVLYKLYQHQPVIKFFSEADDSKSWHTYKSIKEKADKLKAESEDSETDDFIYINDYHPRPKHKAQEDLMEVDQEDAEKDTLGEGDSSLGKSDAPYSTLPVNKWVKKVVEEMIEEYIETETLEELVFGPGFPLGDQRQIKITANIHGVYGNNKKYRDKRNFTVVYQKHPPEKMLKILEANGGECGNYVIIPRKKLPRLRDLQIKDKFGISMALKKSHRS